MLFFKILAYLAGAYFFALAGLYLLQRDILYHPENYYTSPAEAHADPAFHEVATHTADGLDLKAWYAPATTKNITLVFFHGNGDRLRTVVGITRPYLNAGYGFMAVEYRGYSGMPGRPTEKGIYEDARAAMKFLAASGVDTKHMVLFGQSLGTGVAVQMATEYPVAGVILVSPYLSIAKVAQKKYPIFPAEYLVKDRYESFRKIRNINAPLLIAHGQIDNIVPVDQGEELFELAVDPKTFHLFPDAGHNDIFAHGLADLTLDWLGHLPGETRLATLFGN